MLMLAVSRRRRRRRRRREKKGKVGFEVKDELTPVRILIIPAPIVDT